MQNGTKRRMGQNSEWSNGKIQKIKNVDIVEWDKMPNGTKR